MEAWRNPRLVGFAMATYPLAPSIRLEDLLPADLLDKSANRRQR